jgi:signal transduction histidine kinase
MAVIIFILLVFIVFREQYFRKKLWYHETLIQEMPFDSIIMDNKWRFRIISAGAIKDPVKRRWLIGKTDMDYWVLHRKDPAPGQKRMEVFKRALEKRAIESIEETMLDRYGDERTHLRMVKPIFDAKGRHLATIGFSYELTEIKQKERELVALNKDLKRSNEDLDNFAHVASHDLRTPLRGINSFLQLYIRKNRAHFDETDREYIQYISNGAKQMDNLIQSLLSYSGIDRQKIAPKNVNLNKTINSVILNLSSLIIERNAEIIVANLPTIVVQDFLMLQLFQNLIANGIKYNKSAIPTINIFTIEENNALTYVVRDNGIGISAQYKDTVFKIFHRLHSNEEYEGTGIGLAACKRIIELFDGQIWFESDGKGTCFYFTLPNCPVVEKQSLFDKNKSENDAFNALQTMDIAALIQ